MNKRFEFWLPLILLAIIALALRLVGLNWDHGTGLHPDERFVVWVTSDLRWPSSLGSYFNTATSPLNPYNTNRDSFVYGTFPSFLVKAIATPLGMDNYGDLYIVGRVVSAVFDTGTVILTAILARRFFDDRAGLLAGILLAFTPLFLQSAHYFTVDAISVFLVMAGFACVARSWDRSSIGWMVLAGIMIGFAGASKPNYLLSLGFLALPTLELVRTQGWAALIPTVRDRKYPAIVAGVAGGIAAFWAFRIAQPYAFAGPHWWNLKLNQQWLDDLSFWRTVQVGLVDMKPSIQWIDRTPIVYIMQNMVLWGMGITLGITVLAGVIRMLWKITRSEKWPSWWHIGILIWIIGSIVVFGTGIAQNQRYLMHIYPFLIMYAAALLVELQDRLPRAWMGQAITILIVGYTILYGVAFDSIYSRPLTRFAASQWIYDNVADGATISNEYWDDALPVGLPGENPGRFQGLTLDLYADESQSDAKITMLIGQLEQIDYIVLSSNRIIDSVARQPERYPVAVKYYQMLLDGSLGFEPVAEFHQGPEVLGLEWDDRSAEESLTVYEHPEVRIFRKTDRFDAQAITNEFLRAWGSGGIYSIAGDPLPRQMLMTPAELAQKNELGSWAEQVHTGWWQQHPLLSLWLTMNIIGLIAWPLTWRASRNLPDGGWVLAKGVGLIATSALVLVLVSWRSMVFDRGTIVLALMLLAAIGMAVRRCEWNEFVHKVRSYWWPILNGELLFLVIFLIVAWMRSHQMITPDANLMQITAMMRSVSLPPFDPWLSGGLLHTQWAVLLPWATLGKLLAVPPTTMVNLAIIGGCALLGGIVFSLVHTVTRSMVAIGVALVAVLGSNFGFAAGIIPGTTSSSVDIGLITVVLTTALALHLLAATSRNYWPRMSILSLTIGSLIISATWAPIIAISILVTGLGIDNWLRKSSRDDWWPVARRFALELIGVVAAGFVVWFPAARAYTATQRNMIPANMWTLSTLTDRIGLAVLLAVFSLAVGGVFIAARSLMDEGTPGRIVVGIIVISVVGALALAITRNSAGVAIVVLSLLLIIAASSCLHDRVLLWAAGLGLLGGGFLLFAQVRPFHADLMGNSTALGIVPLAWMVLVVAVGLVLIRAMQSAPIKTRLVMSGIAAIIAVLMLIPLATEAIDIRVSPRTALSHPGIIASDTDLAAMDWLTANVTDSPVLLTGDGTISAMSGFPTVLGHSKVERFMRPGWQAYVDRRNTDVETIYTSLQQWDQVTPLLAKYNIRFVVAGPTERAGFGDAVDSALVQAESEGHVIRVFERDGIRIYEIVGEGAQ